MKRPLLVILLAAVVGLGGIVAWTAVSRDREYRRLIAAGDAALAGDQAFQAIEAFSGAIALNHDSMLAYLRRGETYRAELAGGGGWGDGFTRAPERVLQDVRDEKVSLASAARDYGVAIAADGSLDMAGTDRLRAARRAAE